MTVDADANVTLNAGGVFQILAGRSIVINGSVSAPSGNIALQTGNGGAGSIFAPTVPSLGSFDIVVNGTALGGGPVGQ
ncbi:MAG: hypothetical protein WDN50_06405 [Bradyrhizobium sp.]